MAEHYDIEDHDPTVHHEERDINVRAVIWFTVGCVAFGLLLHFGVWFMYKAFVNQERKKDVAMISEVKEPGGEHKQPPAPRLQPFPEQIQMGGGGYHRGSEGLGTELSPVPMKDPVRSTPLADMVEQRKSFEEKLTTYGWVDQRRGIVRIPIAKAKEKLLASGLPVATTTNATAATAPAPVPVGQEPELAAQPKTAASQGAATQGTEVTPGQEIRP